MRKRRRYGEDVDFLCAHFLCETAPVQHGTHAITRLKTRDARTDLPHNARDFCSRHERQGRLALIFALHDQARGETHTRGTNVDTHLAFAQDGWTLTQRTEGAES